MAANDETLEEMTSCCICMDIYTCPKVLPCGHTFCLNCIQEIGQTTSKGPDDEMLCPTCRQTFIIPSKGFTELKTNFSIVSLILDTTSIDQSVAQEVTCEACLDWILEEFEKKPSRAEMYCVDCKQKFCEDCCKHHRNQKLTKNHKFLPINEQRSTEEDLIQSLVLGVCEKHRYNLNMYCHACKIVSCEICFVEHHAGHMGTRVIKAVDEFRKEIAGNIEKVKTLISLAQLKKSEVSKAKHEVHKKLASTKCEIISRREGLKQLVDKHANSLLEELQSIRMIKMKEIQVTADNIEAQLAKLRSYNSDCREMMSKGSDDVTCRIVGSLCTRLNELQRENQPMLENELSRVFVCFSETELGEEDGGNMIGQFREHDNPKQNTKTKLRVIEAEIDTSGATTKTKNMDLNFESEKMTKIPWEQVGTVSELETMLDSDKLSDETLKDPSDDKELLIERLKKEIYNINAEIKFKRTESDVLQLANEKLKENVWKHISNVGKIRQELDNEKLINKTLQNQIDYLKQQITQKEVMTTRPQAEAENLNTEGTSRRGIPKNFWDRAKNFWQTEKSNKSGPQESQSSELERDRINALALLPSIDIDEETFSHLRRRHQYELSRISAKCNLFEKYKVGSQHKLAIGVKPQYSIDSIKAEFRELYHMVTFDCVKVPEGVDIKSLTSLVETMIEFEDVELRYMDEERVYKIAGSYYVDMKRAKQMLIDIIAYKQSSNAKTNRKQPHTTVLSTFTPKDRKPMSHYHPLASGTDLIDLGQTKEPVFTVLNQNHDSLLLSASNSLTIEVIFGDLTRISDVDVLVIDPLANQIAGAAGADVMEELDNLKEELTALQDVHPIHTSAGDLRGVKTIVHVALPQASMFRFNDQRSSDALKDVFTKCLRYINDLLRFNSVCLPPIGLGLYGAQMVVNSFLDAIETFVSTVANGDPSAATHQHPHHHLNYILLVSNDLLSTKQLIKCIKQRLGE